MNKYFILIVILLVIPLVTSTTCPRGLVNDTYPGACNLYTDSNKNNICDYSEQPSQQSQTISSQQSNTQNSNIKINTIKYNITLITIITILLYLATYFLSKKNKISQVTHKKIWNFLLLITFIITAFTSIFYLLKLEYNINLSLPINISFLHIEIGYIMILISIFHMLWHLPYFKTYLKTNLK